MNLPSLALVVVLPRCKCLWLICGACTSVLRWSFVLLGVLLIIVTLILKRGIPIVVLLVEYTLGLVIGVWWGLKWLPWCEPRWLIVITVTGSRGVIWLFIVPLLIVVVSSVRWWQSIVLYWSSIIWEVS